jgi:uncharacterized membrane protein YfcA
MELLVNSIAAWLILIFDVIRGLFEWADKALLAAAGVAIGAYLGTRMALTHFDGRPGPLRGPSILEH